jgi:hypothetical protein
MNAPSKKIAPSVEDALNELDTARTGNVHRKLSAARKQFHTLALKKTGKNTFAGYDYFELGDFLVPALGVFDEVGLGATVSFDRELATMTIRDLDNPDDTITITSPMGSAALKGCHEVQNIGAVETYQRRYLWVAALEIVEHDALDKTTGGVEPRKDQATSTGGGVDPALCFEISDLAPKVGKTVGDICAAYSVEDLADLSTEQAKAAIKRLKSLLAKEPA